MNIKKLLKKIREARKRKLLGLTETKRELKKIEAKVIPSYPFSPIQVRIKGKAGGSLIGEGKGEIRPVIIEYYPIKLPKGEEEEEKIFLKEVSSIIVPKEIVEKLKKVHVETPLIEVTLNGKKKLMAKSIIHWNPEMQSLIYEVIEPKLNEKEKEILNKIKKYIEEKLDVDFTKIRNEEEAKNYIIEKFKEGIKRMGIKLNEEQKFKMVYYLIRDLVGLERIEPLMRDPNIEDISCDGVGLPVFVYHREPMFGEMPTNIVFETREELDNFVIKLAQKCGRSISVAKPLLDGTLPDGSRVQATFGTDIARRGSNFTIRKFFRRILTPVDLMLNNTADEMIFAYFWLAVESRMSILIAGPTASGKTTMLNAISLFIRPEMKIISIEDTAEIKLPHPNWVPHVSRAAFGPRGYGEVTMFDLLKAALRQRPDYIIVGEVRGREAYVMFQGMATGHAVLGTIHAENFDAIVNRLTTPPINLPKAMLTNLDIVTFMIGTKLRGKFVRRIDHVVEITGYDYKKDKILTNTSIYWNPAEDKFVRESSYLLSKIARRLGYTTEELYDEIRRRILVLKWMKKKKITDYRDFWRVIGMYYYNPEELMKTIIEEMKK